FFVSQAVAVSVSDPAEQTSLFGPPSRLSSPEPPQRVSLPKPPRRSSSPEPPFRKSAPVRPRRSSSPEPPQTTSLPPFPLKVSLPSSRATRSLAGVPVSRSGPEVPTMVASRPRHRGVAPLPERATAWGLLGALSVIRKVALCAPALTGENETAIAQASPNL